MSGYLLLAGVAAAGIYAYVSQKEASDAETDKETKSPGDAYKLPDCCVNALKTTTKYGALAGSIGVFLAVQDQVGKIGNPTSLATYDPKAEAEKHTSLWTGTRAVKELAEFEVIKKHYWKHLNDNGTDAKKFWTRIYHQKRKRLPDRARGAYEAFHSADDVVTRPE